MPSKEKKQQSKKPLESLSVKSQLQKLEKQVQEELKDPRRVVASFEDFIKNYQYFRLINGLNATLDNPYETLVGMIDKAARICRQVKHFERNDPKSDWPEGVSESATGLIIYLLMILETYDIDISKGMFQELSNAKEQHGK